MLFVRYFSLISMTYFLFFSIFSIWFWMLLVVDMCFVSELEQYSSLHLNLSFRTWNVPFDLTVVSIQLHLPHIYYLNKTKELAAVAAEKPIYKKKKNNLIRCSFVRSFLFFVFIFPFIQGSRGNLWYNMRNDSFVFFKYIEENLYFSCVFCVHLLIS